MSCLCARRVFVVEDYSVLPLLPRDKNIAIILCYFTIHTSRSTHGICHAFPLQKLSHFHYTLISLSSIYFMFCFWPYALSALSICIPISFQKRKMFAHFVHFLVTRVCVSLQYFIFFSSLLLPSHLTVQITHVTAGSLLVLVARSFSAFYIYRWIEIICVNVWNYNIVVFDLFYARCRICYLRANPLPQA